MAEPTGSGGGNILWRIIRLFLDKDSAKKTTDDAKGVAAEIEGGWKSMAARVAGYLGAAFLIKKIVDFGKASVHAAAESQVAWNELRGAIMAVGGSFTAMESGLRAAGEAFQDATVHDNEAYATSLARMVSLTGDVSASVNNMGLVANVAARFFGGELAPATDLVSKAMNGNVASLQRMGIHAKDAQQALEILATRSMGAAVQETQTFSGRLAQINNLWEDFLKLVGFAVTDTQESADAFEIVSDALQTMMEWVQHNRKAIGEWVSGGIRLAITATDVLYRALLGMTNILRGSFDVALSIAVDGLGYLATAYAVVVEGAANFVAIVSEEKAAAMRKHAAAIRADADALHEWSDAAFEAGTARAAAGFDRLATPTGLGEGGSSRHRPHSKLPGGKTPKVAEGGSIEEQNIQKAIDDFGKAGAQITAMQAVLGKNFDATDAEIKRTTDLMVALAENGVAPTDERFMALGRQLQLFTQYTDPVNQVLQDVNDKLGIDAVIAAAKHESAFDQLTSQAQLLESAMVSLIEKGIDPQDPRLKGLEERYKSVTKAIREQTLTMAVGAGVADFFAEAVGDSMKAGIGPAAKEKAKQNKIEAIEWLVRAVGFAIFGDFAHSGAALKQAGSHAALAVAWGALASANPNGGGSAATPAVSAGSVSAGALSSARAVSSGPATQAQPLPPEVNITLVGDGWDALNPAVQKVVLGAYNEGLSNYGNATVRVKRSSA